MRYDAPCEESVEGGTVMTNFFSSYWADFVGRFDGPLHFRLIVQPLMAALLAVRDGRKDARAGQTAYLWSMVTDATQRRYLLTDGWKGISKVFAIAVALDCLYQLMVWRELRPLQVLMTAIVLAVVPYIVLRGPINRLMSARRG
jgi:hypothetical protein